MSQSADASAVRFPAIPLGVALLVTAILPVWLGWSAYSTYRNTEQFTHEELRIEELRGTIVHLDEVLTMSARMAAVTGDLSWEERYNAYVPQLDAAIKEALAKDTLRDAAVAASTDAANLALVDMEVRAFELVREGRLEEAQAILFSAEYATHKATYAAGTEDMLARLGTEVDARVAKQREDAVIAVVAAVGILLASALAWRIVLASLRRWRVQLIRARDELDARVHERTRELAAVNASLTQEIADRRRLEDEAAAQREIIARQERLTALGTLVAGVAHEINNPLAFIRANLQLAQADIVELPAASVTPETRGQLEDSLTTVLDGVDRIQKIVWSLRVVAREEKATHEPVELNQVVENVAALVRAGIPAGVTAEFQLAPTSVIVQGSPEALHRALLNVAKNALEACANNGGAVRVSVSCSDGVGRLRVEDSGPGMSETTKARLFTPFFTTKTSGTGLGLAIVHSIVKDHRGETRVDSAVGRGTTVTIELPLDGR